MKKSSGFTAALLSMTIAFGCTRSDAPAFGTPVTRRTHVFFPIESPPHALECSACHTDGETFTRYKCTNCHAHERDRTFASHFSITENFVYEDTSCYGCHPTASGVRFDHAAYFPIRDGSKHARLGCIECHQNTADRHEVTCLSCHPPVPTDGQHTHVKQGPNGYEQVSVSCLKCHPDARVFPVSQHGPFHISEGFKHYRVGCPECHNQVLLEKPWQIDFSHRWCLDCHLQPDIADVHADKPTYRYDSVTCLSVGCHAQGTKNN